MRPHFLTSAVFSLSRLNTTSAISSRTTTTTAATALKSLAATCPQQRLFSSSPLQCGPLARPQVKNHQRLSVSATSSASFSTTTTMATPIKAQSFIDLIKERRTFYALNKDLVISKERIQEIVKESVTHVPSSFNSQSSRTLVLFGAEHDKLWDFVSEALKAIVPADSWDKTAARIAMFKAGAGTVLFFTDQDTVNEFQTNIPLYSDKFPIWATQADGMLQFAVWTALTAEGLGANLQHYNPLVDAKVAAEWGIPDSWKLTAQLVFGGRAGDAGPKEFKPIEERFKVAGA